MDELGENLISLKDFSDKWVFYYLIIKNKQNEKIESQIEKLLNELTSVKTEINRHDITANNARACLSAIKKYLDLFESFNFKKLLDKSSTTLINFMKMELKNCNVSNTYKIVKIANDWFLNGKKPKSDEENKVNFISEQTKFNLSDITKILKECNILEGIFYQNLLAEAIKVYIDDHLLFYEEIFTKYLIRFNYKNNPRTKSFKRYFLTFKKDTTKESTLAVPGI
ncbi:hypothetical protein MXB_1455, partial [Myxobolus squamalis]